MYLGTVDPHEACCLVMHTDQELIRIISGNDVFVALLLMCNCGSLCAQIAVRSQITWDSSASREPLVKT